MRILITAGPTREYLDPVRFLTNASTGKMGYACAAAATRRGHQVTLVSGPVALKRPAGVERIDVLSSTEMYEAVLAHYPVCDAVIMTAAVCDYRPAQRSTHKLTKQPDGLLLPLVRTADILAALGRQKQRQVLIGFAVQDRAARSRARGKLADKNLDAIVLNGPAAFGADGAEAALLVRGRPWEPLGAIRKTVLATRLVRLAEQLVRQRAQAHGGAV